MAEEKRTQNYVTSLVAWDDVAETTRSVTAQNLTNSVPLDVAIVDGDGTQIDFSSMSGPGAPTVDSYAHIAINLNAGNDQLLVSSASSKQIWVYGVAFTLSVAGTVSFQDEDNTAITGILDHAANSGLALGVSGNFAMPIWKLATNKDLEIDITSASVDGWLDYAIISV